MRSLPEPIRLLFDALRPSSGQSSTIPTPGQTQVTPAPVTPPPPVPSLSGTPSGAGLGGQLTQWTTQPLLFDPDDVYAIMDTAIEHWGEVASTEWPMTGSPVVKADPDPTHHRHWNFYTYGNVRPRDRRIHFDVFKPDEVIQLFTGVQHLYTEAYGVPIQAGPELVKRLMHDVFFYLDGHEQFHPTFCPSSKADKELCDLALYRGIQIAEPHLRDPVALPGQPQKKNPLVLKKVGNVRNSVWDQIIDGAFQFKANYGGSLERRVKQVLADSPMHTTGEPLPDGLIPIFDIFEFERKDEPFESLEYPLSRAIYSLLFCKTHQMRESLFGYFKDRVTQQMPESEFDDVIKGALKGFVSDLSQRQLRFARITRNDYDGLVDTLYDNHDTSVGDTALQRYMEITTGLLLNTRTRYDAIQGHIQPLAPYISLRKEEKRAGTHIQEGGEPGDEQTDLNQPGGNTEEALVNIINQLPEDEANALLEDVANMPNQFMPDPQDERLSSLAIDEYYRRNARAIPLRSTSREVTSVSKGSMTEHLLTHTDILSAEDVAFLDLEEVQEFQQQTGKPRLRELEPGVYQLLHYEEVELPQVDFTNSTTGLELPDNVVLHIDSSNSMGGRGGKNYIGDKGSYDTLMHVGYGILQTLRDASTKMGKDPKVIVTSFGTQTIVSDPVPLSTMYDTPNNSAKRVLTNFQDAGGTSYEPGKLDDIKDALSPGKTVHLLVTDGALSPVQELYDKFETHTQNPDTSFLYFQIGEHTSTFGSKIKALSTSRPNVGYHGDVNIKKIQNEALDVMLTYS